MAWHPAENWKTKGQGASRIVKYTLSSNCQPYSSSNLALQSGLAEKRVRSASQYTAKDRLTGWRQPLPYQYQSIRCYNPLGGETVATVESCPGRKYDGMPAQATTMWPYDPYNVQGTPFERFSGIPKANMMNFVKTKALAKLGSHKVALGETFGEIRQTYAMVHGLIRDIRWFWRRLRMNDLESVRQYILYNFDPFSAYLACRYGWSPLIKDIEAMIDRIDAQNKGTYERLRVYVKAGHKQKYEEHKGMTLNGGDLYADFHITGEERCFVRYDYVPTGPAAYRTAAELGLLPNVFWELRTYSFLVDWVLNIGTFLEAAVQIPGWRYKAGSETSFGRYSGTGRYTPGACKHIRGAFPKGEWISFNRTVQYTAPLPTLAIDPRILNGILSPWRIADAVSLMGQDFVKTARYIQSQRRPVIKPPRKR